MALAALAVTGLAATSARAAPAGAGTGRAFDVRGAEHRSGFGAAVSWARRTDQNRYRPGFELRWADELAWYRSMFGIHSTSGASLRVLQSGYALSLGQPGGLAGVRFGAFELVAGTGVSMINAEWIDGKLGFGLLWPRSSAGASVRLGALRFDISGHVEYLWSWFARDHLVRGLGLLVSFEQPPLKPSFAHR